MHALVLLIGILIGCILNELLISRKSCYGNFLIDIDEDGDFRLAIAIPNHELKKITKKTIIILRKDKTQK